MLFSVTSEAFRQQYASVFEGDARQGCRCLQAIGFEWEGRRPTFANRRSSRDCR